MHRLFFFPFIKVTTLKIPCTNKGISNCLNLQIPSEHTAGASGVVVPPHFPGPGNTHHMLHVLLSPNSFPGQVMGERHWRAGGSLPASRLMSLWSPLSRGPELRMAGWCHQRGQKWMGRDHGDPEWGLGVQQVTCSEGILQGGKR